MLLKKDEQWDIMIITKEKVTKLEVLSFIKDNISSMPIGISVYIETKFLK